LKDEFRHSRQHEEEIKPRGTSQPGEGISAAEAAGDVAFLGNLILRISIKKKKEKKK